MQGGRSLGTLLPDLSGSESTLSYPPAFVKRFFRLSDIFWRVCAYFPYGKEERRNFGGTLPQRRARHAIEDILPAADEATKAELEREYGEYEKLVSRAAALAHEKGIILKEPGPFKKAMMWSSIKLNTMKDDSRAHIAEMMTKGTVVGITSLKSSLSDCPDGMDGEVRELVSHALGMEEGFERIWKAMICA